MISKSPRDIVSGISEIGNLPQTLAAVLKVLNNSRSGADEIAEIISRDVSLTSRVLRLVNSVQFGRRRKITKVSEAVIVMGLNSIKVLTLSSSVFGMVADRELLEKINIKRVWRHLIETASTARRIAMAVGYREPEEAFVAGILHDVGIIIMLLHFKEKYFEVIERMKQDSGGIIMIEKEILGMDHEEVGAEMINCWKLSPKLISVASNHHFMKNATIMEEDRTLVDIIALADRLSMGPFDGYYPDIEMNIQSIQKICGRINLAGDAAREIRKDSLLESLKMAEYLELDIGDILELLTEANEKLAELYFSLEKVYLEKQKLMAMIDRESHDPVPVTG